jgi:hypothetical protein
MKDPIAVELGSRGGFATSKTHTKEHYRQLQVKSVQARLKAKKLVLDSGSK